LEKSIMTTHDESPIIRTSKKRLAQGLAIIVITMAVGAAIAVPYWNEMAQTPPPVSTIVIESPIAPEGEDEIQEGTEEAGEAETGGATGTGAEGGTTAPATGTTVTILTGSSVQGNPDYEPDDAEVPLSDNIVWVNEDTVPHTATSGTGAEDANSGKIFDTSIINGGEESSPVQLTGVKEGDEVPYYCQVHPYMTSKLTVGAASAGGATAATGATAGNASSVGGGSSSNATTTTSTTSTSAGGNTSSTSGDTAASAGSTAGNASSAGGGGNATTTTPAPPATTAATTAAATLTIPQGASVQGNEYYDPAELSIKAGDTIAVENKDTTPHTVTNGKDATDPNMGKLFDTSIINAGDSADVVTADLKPGEYPFFCSVHPYMKGSLTVQ
jgi:plastocyanin